MTNLWVAESGNGDVIDGTIATDLSSDIWEYSIDGVVYGGNFNLPPPPGGTDVYLAVYDLAVSYPYGGEPAGAHFEGFTGSLNAGLIYDTGALLAFADANVTANEIDASFEVDGGSFQVQTIKIVTLDFDGGGAGAKNGGTLTAQSVEVGDFGTGLYAESGGSFTAQSIQFDDDGRGAGIGILVEDGTFLSESSVYDPLGMTVDGGSVTIDGDFEVNYGAVEAGGTLEVTGNLSDALLVLGYDSDLFAQDDGPGSASIGGGVTDSTVSLTAHSDLTVGDEFDGSIELTEGSTAEISSFFSAGVDAAGSDTVFVDESTLTVGGTLDIGFAGNGTFTVAGGTVNANGGLREGVEAGSSAMVMIGISDTDGSPDSGGTVTVIGDYLIGINGTSQDQVVDAAQVKIQGDLIAGEFDTGQGSLTISGAGTTENVSGQIVIGDEGIGSLTVNAGAVLSSTYGAGPAIDLGASSGGMGTMTVSDSGTDLVFSSGTSVVVGDEGTGTLSILNGATFEADSTDPTDDWAMDIGRNTTGNGTVTVDGEGSTLTVGSGGLSVGDAGQGSLTVSNGATLDVTDTTYGMVIGTNDGSSGTVDIAGDGSTLNSDGPIIVGESGTGTLMIEDGGAIAASSDDAYISIGSVEGGNGTATVTGASTTVEFDGTLTVGDAGTGTLDIFDGATWTTQGDVIVGAQDTGTGTIEIAGDGSSLTVGGDLTLGQDGEANLTVNDSGDLTIDGDVDAGISNVEIESDASIKGDFYLGIDTADTGQADLVTMVNAISAQGGGTTNATTAGLVTPVNANWTVGGGNALTVTGSVDIGVNAGNAGTLTVTGANTQLVVETDLIVGDGGSGTLNVQNAAVTNVTGAITLGAQSTGVGQITINGNGSTINAGTQDVTIGDAGSGTLNIQMAALFDADSVGVTLGSQNGSTGFLTIANEDSEVDAGTLTVGDDGTGAVTISDGGDLSVGGDAVLGGQSDGYGSLTLADSQSSSDIGGDLTVGDAGGALLLNDGDTDVSGKLSVGAQSSGSGQVTVSVGTLDVDGDANVGEDGAGTLLVELGGTFDAQNVTLGMTLGSSGTFSVDGEETNATTNDLTIGTSGSGLLHVSDGAALTTMGDATLGEAASANIDNATIDTQGNWGIDGDLTVGGSGIATMNLLTGGTVADSGSVVLGDQSGATGELTVSGFATASDNPSQSTFNWGGTLTVGNHGQGTLTVTNGALVAPTQGGSGELDIAAMTGSNGTSLVSGTGSELDADKIAIGGTLVAAGGAGTLTVAQGASAVIGTSVTMWGGTLDVSGGGLAIIGKPGLYRTAPDQVLVAPDGLLAGNGLIDGNVTVNGAIDATDGILTISGNVTGTGTIDVGNGATLEIDGDLSGTVSIDIAAGATVELGGSFSAHTNINFDYASDGSSLGGQSLIIDNPQAVLTSIGPEEISGPINNGSITGLAAGDEIILKGLNYSSSNPIFAAAITTLNNAPSLDVWQGHLVNGGDSGNGNLPGENANQIYIPIFAAPGSAVLSSDYFNVTNADNDQDTELTLKPGNAVDLAVDGPTARSTYGRDGTNVIVGVISNSSEAYAMANVVHEIAPGATTIEALAYHVSDFVTTINQLVVDGANIIVDDLEFFKSETGAALEAIDNAIDSAYAKGVTFVSAAGNDRPPFSKQIPVYGHQLDPYELSTAAMNVLATPSAAGGYIPVATDPYSSIGKVDITGPVGGPTKTSANPFFGTSAAAPAVAGVAALMISEDRGLAHNPGQLYQEIEGSAGYVGELSDEAGAGLVQADAALDVAAADKDHYFTQASLGLNVVDVELSHPGDVTTDDVEQFVLTMSEGVSVNGTGTPALVLNNGAEASYVPTLSTPTNGTLVFDYLVSASDATSDLAVTGFDLEGTTIVDGNGNTADFSGIFGVGSGTSVNSPFLAQSISTSLTGEASSGQTVQLTLTMNEAAAVVTTGGDPTLSLSDGATADYDASASNPSAGQLVFDYQVGASDTDPNLSVVAVNLPTDTTIKDGNDYNADFSAILVQPTALQIGPVSLQALNADVAGSADTGTEVQLTLAFSGPVALDTTNGSPTLSLNDNETATYDPAASNLANGEIVFDYAVAKTDQTPDLGATSYNADGSVLQDAHGMSVDLAGLTDVSTGISVNSPLLATAATPSLSGEIDTGTELQITISFNEGISLYGADNSDGPTLNLNDGATATFDGEGADNQSLVFDYLVGSSDQTSNLAIAGIDLNAANIFDDNGYQADFSSILNTSLDVSINEASQPCYCRGTFILTSHGEKCVENLEIGEMVITLSGEERPIKWIGHRSYTGRFVMGRADVLPICFKAGSLQDNVPKRDLWISPHHAMYLEGVLIEARDLVNGVSIVQAESVERVEYFHIELESHDVILAEGSLSESFIDDDSRGMFHNAHDFNALYPGIERIAARYCVPRQSDGYEVEAARRHIDARAGLRPAVAEVPATLRGCVDVVNADCIAGWAQNAAHPEAPICLDVFAGGQLIGRTLANRFREDLKHAGIGSGNQSFEFKPSYEIALTDIVVRRSIDGALLPSSAQGAIN